MRRYDAVLFDLLTALIDSWSLWNRVAGSEAQGRAWRGEYLKLTYGCGAYRPYETLVEEAAVASGLPASRAKALEDEWLALEPWAFGRHPALYLWIGTLSRQRHHDKLHQRNQLHRANQPLRPCPVQWRLLRD